MAFKGQRIRAQAAQALWPARCVLCGLHDPSLRLLCPGCEGDLPVAPGHCARCAMPRPRDMPRCGFCLKSPPQFDHAVAAWRYETPVRALVQRFKFSGGLAEGRVLAHFMARSLAERQVERPQLMVPVPLHWLRRWRRGFNQSELLCRDLSRNLGGLPWARLLDRSRPTPAQSDLPAGQRLGNVRGAFRPRQLPPGLAHVALVDDVMTTAATLSECARELKCAGVLRVDAWVIARA